MSVRRSQKPQKLGARAWECEHGRVGVWACGRVGVWVCGRVCLYEVFEILVTVRENTR